MVSNRRFHWFHTITQKHCLTKYKGKTQKNKNGSLEGHVFWPSYIPMWYFLLIIPQKLDRQTAFHMACEQGAMPIVEYLVGKDPAVCRITLVDCKGKTPLHMAAKRNHAHVVSFLLEKVCPASLLSTFFLVINLDEILSLVLDMSYYIDKCTVSCTNFTIILVVEDRTDEFYSMFSRWSHFVMLIATFPLLYC